MSDSDSFHTCPSEAEEIILPDSEEEYEPVNMEV